MQLICSILFRTNLLWLGKNIRFYYEALIGQEFMQGSVLEILAFIQLYS